MAKATKRKKVVKTKNRIGDNPMFGRLKGEELWTKVEQDLQSLFDKMRKRGYAGPSTATINKKPDRRLYRFNPSDFSATKYAIDFVVNSEGDILAMYRVRLLESEPGGMSMDMVYANVNRFA